MKENIIINSIEEHRKVFDKIITESTFDILQCAKLIWDTLAKGKKILLCGNGGSAADAQHLAAEFVGRYETERRGFPAIALTTDTSALTALGNDYGYERVFARQVEALANEGDLLIGLSTSGNSPNVIAALTTAREIGCVTIGLTGEKGGEMTRLCDFCLRVPSARTARIQEAHITIAHIWCEFVDEQVKLETAAGV
jgi:D-sedoheptulose 7-phosphate isomerase